MCDVCQHHLLFTRLRDKRIRKSGPNFLMFTSAGKRLSVFVPNTFARIKSSPSGTRRCCVSSFASDSRLTSQPKTCNRADNSSCVQPLRSRKSRTFCPIRFNGGEIFLILANVTAREGTNVRFRSQIGLARNSFSRKMMAHPEGNMRMQTQLKPFQPFSAQEFYFFRTLSMPPPFFHLGRFALKIHHKHS